MGLTWIAVILGMAAVLVLVLVFLFTRPEEPPHKTAGRMGEETAAGIVRTVLREGDALFSNVSIAYDGRPAELDQVIVNRNGVFVIEVKTYSGRLFGDAEDFEWRKEHISEGGNLYVKSVKNPIRQVKREVYILANFLRYYGVSVWVEGYAMILGAASPVISDRILSGAPDIDRVIHTPGKQRLDRPTVDSILRLLSYQGE